MKLAIMQPYFFPYIGYFQLINAVDKFIVYDDVNYIKGGWINRNNILINNQPKFINVQLSGASSFKTINQVLINPNFKKVLKSIEQNYSKTPFFNSVYSMIERLLKITKSIPISELNWQIIVEINNYLGIKTKIELSSINYKETKGLNKERRIEEICRINSSKYYINPIGGKELYSKDLFMENNIKLYFIKSNHIEYKQFGGNFTPCLSIIDVMMFNSVEKINIMLEKYSLI